MSYLSIEFGALFFCFLVLYWLAAFSIRLQNLLLLTASYTILGSFSTNFAAVLFAYTVVVYLLARFIHKTDYRRVGSFLIVLLVVGVFTVFKYYDFFRSIIETLAGAGVTLPVLDILLPIGLSFYVFHSVSYLVSLKNRELPPVSFLTLALYLSFFPSLVSGPINRAREFLPQLLPGKIRQPIFIRKAFFLIGLSILKLMLLSALLAEHFVNPVFASPASFSPEENLLAVYAYAFQIYFNFSGYTNLVTGMALLLGFKLPVNFNFPYLANNIREFWQRWHISLSSFIRDYVYIPLGGSKKGFVLTQVNLFVAMVLSGIWHGVGENFIIWGALNGMGLVLLNIRTRYLPFSGVMIQKIGLSRLMTFHFICFTWIFFRGETYASSLEVIHRIAGITLQGIIHNHALLVFLGFLMLYPLLVQSFREFWSFFLKLPSLVFTVLLALFVYLVFVFSPPGVPDFIYASF